MQNWSGQISEEQEKTQEPHNEIPKSSSTYRASVVDKKKPVLSPNNQVQLLPTQNKVHLLPTPSANEQKTAPETMEAEDTSEIPKIIGQIQMDKHSTLWGMLETVYGESNTQSLQAVIQENPWMDNPDIIPPGQEISFPVLSISQQLPEGKNRINLSKTDNLNQAYQQAQNAGLDNFRILALHSPAEGFMFWVVSQDSFPDQASAQQALEGMSNHIQQKASVVSLSKLDPDWKLVTAE